MEECPFCREEIKQGAKKCKACNEVLGARGKLRSFFSIFSGLLATLVPLGSLSIAFFEYKSREIAVTKMEIAEKDKRAAEEILMQMPREDILSAAKEEFEIEVEPDIRDVAPNEEPQEGKKIREIKDLISKGNKAFKAGQEGKAEEYYHKAVNLERTLPQKELFQRSIASQALGRFYIQIKKHKKAKKEFERAVRQNPNDMEARKGLIYSKILANRMK